MGYGYSVPGIARVSEADPSHPNPMGRPPKTLDNFPPTTTADGKNVCFRVPVGLREQAEALALTLGVSISELMRALLLKELGQPALVGVDQGYEQGRRLALHMLQKILGSAVQMLPDTYEEAVHRFGLASPPPEPSPSTEDYDPSLDPNFDPTLLPPGTY